MVLYPNHKIKGYIYIILKPFDRFWHIESESAWNTEGQGFKKLSSRPKKARCLKQRAFFFLPDAFSIIYILHWLLFTLSSPNETHSCRPDRSALNLNSDRQNELPIQYRCKPRHAKYGISLLQVPSGQL